MREPYDIRDSHSSCKKLIMNINQYLSHYNSHYTLYEKTDRIHKEYSVFS